LGFESTLTIGLVNVLEQEKAKGKVGQIPETLVRLDLMLDGPRSSVMPR